MDGRSLSRAGRTAFAVVAAVALGAMSGCTHVQANPAELVAKLKDAPDGYVTGDVVTLQKRVQIDNKDFIYTIAFSPHGEETAHTRLAGKTTNVALWTLAEPPHQLIDEKLNEYQFDVETAAFSPDGKRVVTGGRDGALRFFDAATGAPAGVAFAEEPLVSVAWSQDGKHVLAGTAHGLVLVFRADGAYESEVRAHKDEVRALAVADDGTVFSGGWDKAIVAFSLGEAPVAIDEIHLAVAQTENKVAVVRAGVGGKMGVFAFDAAQPYVVISADLAHSIGLQESLLSETVRVNGNEAKLAHGQSVNLKQLTIDGLDVAVCGNCLPKGEDGILGAPVLSRFDLATNPLNGELVLVAKEKHDPATLPKTTALTEKRRFTMDAFVNDLTVDRPGKRLGVALSHDKAERNRDVYQREKNKVAPPYFEEDTAALVDAGSGEVMQRWHPHTTIVSTVGISPDGKALVSGGWDNEVFVLREGAKDPVQKIDYAWIVRRIRFSRDGRLVGVAAWTPQNALGDQQSEPSCVVYDVAYTGVGVEQ